MPKVTTIEIKNDKTGTPMKVTTFDSGQKVFVNSKWDEAIYDKVVENAEFELIQDGAFTKVKYDKPVANGAGFGRSGGISGGIKVAQETKRADIKTAQEFNRTSVEISATFRDATLITLAEMSGHPIVAKDFQERWSYWRQWLLTNFDPNETKRELGF